jgi:hypothetical protein
MNSAQTKPLQSDCESLASAFDAALLDLDGVVYEEVEEFDDYEDEDETSETEEFSDDE